MGRKNLILEKEFAFGMACLISSIELPSFLFFQKFMSSFEKSSSIDSILSLLMPKNLLQQTFFALEKH